MTKEEQAIYDYVNSNYRTVVMGREHRALECGTPYISYAVAAPSAQDIVDYFKNELRLPEGDTLHWRTVPSICRDDDGSFRIHTRFAVT